MTSLFTPFDLHCFFMSFSFILISFYTFLNSLSKTSVFLSFLNLLFNSLMKFFLSLKPKLFNKVSGLMFISIFFLMMTINLSSVFSFNFPMTSQVSMVMMLSLGFWISLILFSICRNAKGLISHLIPEGTPLPLTILLFLIEMVSNAIRPLTLMVRLVANILAGHLLMILLSSLVFILPASSFFYVVLNLVEMLVALIQAYIFTTMIVLYFAEV